MTADQFRQIAISLPEVEERAHMGHPDFRKQGKIFATIADPIKGIAMVKLLPEQQQSYLNTNPETFFAAQGAWGRAGCTMVRLAVADPEMMGEALTAAWKAIVPKPKVQRTVNPPLTKRDRKP